jgi:RNA polymerase sigma-70 factor (ECF subfamily)
MDEQRELIAAWMAREIVPHERAVRGWLSRHWRQTVDAEDVIQEAYCRIAGLTSVDHIDNPGGYFQRTVRAVAIDLSRRAAVIDFTALSQTEWSTVMDNDPSADRTIEAGQELGRVRRMLAQLSETSRRVIELRRIEGLSRKETAERLGVSEIEVKNDLVRALQKVMRTMAEQDAQMSGDDRPAKEQKGDAIGKRRLP